MTEQEARTVFDIARSAHDYCTECAMELAAQLSNASPTWPWMEWAHDNLGADMGTASVGCDDD